MSRGGEEGKEEKNRKGDKSRKKEKEKTQDTKKLIPRNKSRQIASGMKTFLL